MIWSNTFQNCQWGNLGDISYFVRYTISCIINNKSLSLSQYVRRPRTWSKPGNIYHNKRIPSSAGLVTRKTLISSRKAEESAEGSSVAVGVVVVGVSWGLLGWPVVRRPGAPDHNTSWAGGAASYPWVSGAWELLQLQRIPIRSSVLELLLCNV